MNLTAYRGDDALDILADLMEPVVEIFGDRELAEAWRENRAMAVKMALKGHKKSVFQMLAIIDREDYEDPEALEAYKQRFNVFTLPARLMELFNDPVLVDLFTSQVPNTDKTSFGPATENTEATDAE